MRFQLATLVRGSSATAHCYAATALLTREYQGDDRRQSLTSAATRASQPLDFSFHIRGRGRVGESGVGFCAMNGMVLAFCSLASTSSIAPLTTTSRIPAL